MSGLLDECYVATPDQDIYEFIESIDGKIVMTSHSHEMCNDRLVEAVNIIENEKQTSVGDLRKKVLELHQTYLDHVQN